MLFVTFPDKEILELFASGSYTILTLLKYVAWFKITLSDSLNSQAPVLLAVISYGLFIGFE